MTLKIANLRVEKKQKTANNCDSNNFTTTRLKILFLSDAIIYESITHKMYFLNFYNNMFI